MLSAEIIRLCHYQTKAETDLEIDPCTAVHVAVRDLQDIEAHWGTELGRERLMECLAMLRTLLSRL